MASERPTTIPDPPAELGALGKRAWAQIWLEPQITRGDWLTVERLSKLEDESADLRATLAERGAILTRPVQVLAATSSGRSFMSLQRCRLYASWARSRPTSAGNSV